MTQEQEDAPNPYLIDPAWLRYVKAMELVESRERQPNTPETDHVPIQGEPHV